MCNINQNIVLDCINSAGSVVRAFVTNGPAEAIAETAGNVTSITVGGSPLTAADWYEFQVKPQTSSFTETGNVSVENGTLFFQKDLSLSFPKMDVEKRNQLLLAAQNDKMIIAFEDANGTFWMFGSSKGGYTSALTTETGADYASKNGYSVTLSATELEPVYTIDSSIVVA